MNKSARIIVLACSLLLLVVGSVFAVRNPVGDTQPTLLAGSHEPKPSESSGTDEKTNPADEKTNETAEQSGPPSEALVQRVLDRLGKAGITTDAGALSGLIDAYGVGGAVRVLSWVHAGASLAEIQKMHDQDNLGWGEIARQLNAANAALDLKPGIGPVMSGGHGHGVANGRASAPGQAGKDH